MQAIIEKHSNTVFLLLKDTVEQSVGQSVPSILRAFVRSILNIRSLNPELHRICIEQAFRLGLEHIKEVRRAAEQLVESYLVEQGERIIPQDKSLAALVLVTTVDTNIHIAMISSDPPDMDALGEELIAMVLRYLGIEDDEVVPG